MTYYLKLLMLKLWNKVFKSNYILDNGLKLIKYIIKSKTCKSNLPAQSVFRTNRGF